MMKYKFFVLLLTMFVLSACGAEVKKEASPTANPTPTVTVKDLVWNDEAGFSFSYPENIKVAADADDNVSYANLTTSDGVKILAVDSKYKDVTAWVGGEKTLKDGVVSDIKLSGKEGKKIVKNGKTTMGIIDDKILFTVEIPAESKWGQKIVDTFTLVYPTPKASNKAPVNDESGAVLEEEVVE